MKPSTEALLLSIDLCIKADIEKRSDLSREVIIDLVNLKSKIQYLKEIDCE